MFSTQMCPIAYDISSQKESYFKQHIWYLTVFYYGKGLFKTVISKLVDSKNVIGLPFAGKIRRKGWIILEMNIEEHCEHLMYRSTTIPYPSNIGRFAARLHFLEIWETHLLQFFAAQRCRTTYSYNDQKKQHNDWYNLSLAHAPCTIDSYQTLSSCFQLLLRRR